ncbi:MAG: hypothetical protein R2805_00755 [Flavobacterium sp.]|uniref:hypothetical protein n=1 Tax=Flavobacterium sp. TaxID=239 RepID=UPI003527F860
MKKKILILAVLILSITISCKNEEKKKDTESNTEKLVVKENFNVEIDVTADSSDDFTVYYTEDRTNQFDGDKAVWSGVKGGLESEKVIFDLPEAVIPTNIRLDFGIKKDRKDEIIHNIKISYYDRAFNIKGSDFFNYFIKNENIPTKINTLKGTITIQSNPQADGTYFYPRQELLDEITKLTK